MDNYKGLLVFCEGAHDVAFIYRILKIFFNASSPKGESEKGLKFSEYPSPFNQFFAQNVKNYAAQDLSLDMAKKFFLPDRVLIKDDWFIFLFNTGGKSQVQKIKIFLQGYLKILPNASTFTDGADKIIIESKYLFVYDADHQTANDVACWMQKEFNIIDDTTWTLDAWEIESKKRSIINDDKAIYVWCGSDGKGTLEDFIIPVYQNKNKELIDNSSKFVEDNFEWSIEGKGPNQQSKIKASKLKATLCVAGQGKRAGKPLSAIIHDNILADKESFLAIPTVQDFAQLVHDFTGLNIET